MATHDHTARARLFVPSPGGHAPFADTPAMAGESAVTQQRLIHIHSIANAADALLNLLLDGEAAQAGPMPAQPLASRRLPLTLLETEGLVTAVHYLHAYAHILGREPSQNA